MDKSLTMKEIEVKYHSEWILLQDPKTGKDLKVVRGKVVCHSKDRDAVYRKAIELRPKKFAVLYTGALPKNTAIVL